MYHTQFKITNGDANREFEKIVKKVMIKAMNDVEQLEIEKCDLNTNNIEFDNFEKLKYLKINARERECVTFWLSKLNPEVALEEFYFSTRQNSLFEFKQIDYPSVLNAGEMLLTRHVHITDEEFSKINIRKSCFRTDSLSTKSLMEFVRKWVDGEMRDDFDQCQIRTQNDYRKEIEEALDSYHFDATPYNYGSFRIDNRVFFQNFERFGYDGKFWQISKRNDPFNSVSVLITRNCFVVIRTGFPCIKNGREDVKLVFPKDVLYCYYYINY